MFFNDYYRVSLYLAMSLKRRGIIAHVDSDSDDDLHVQANVAISRASTSVVTTVHSNQLAAKRQRVAEVQESCDAAEPELKDERDKVEQEKPKRKQGASVMMETFAQSFDVLQDAILATEIHHTITMALSKVSQIMRFQNWFQTVIAHRIDQHFQHRRPGSLAVRCPACPEIGFNIEKDVIDRAREDEAHKYTFFLSTDGNFRLQRKNKNNDEDDVALNNGNAYFVPTQAFKQYIDVVRSGKEDDSPTCPQLRAAKLQNVVKFKNAAVTSVVAFQCARHGFYLPQSIVDLVKGEAYSFTDFAFAYVLIELIWLRWILLSYDIWCHYHVNLVKRFRERFPTLAGVVSRVRGTIPKMHVVNYVLMCMLLYGFNYLPFSGETWGENIEGGWAEQNQSAGSTKEMNDGHRHDSLDDMFGYWNWMKLHNMPETLTRMYKNCIETLKIRENDFTSLTEMHDPKLIAKWKLMDKTPKKGKDGVVTSVYEVCIAGGPPTLNKTYQLLLKDQNESQGDDELVCLIHQGLYLEERQRSSKIKRSTTAATLASDQKLADDISGWWQKQITLLPSLQNEIDSTTADAVPEDLPLHLPSSFSADRREELGLVEAATVEFKLREGQAHDTLQDVRTAIKTVNANVHFKKNNVSGQGPNTRAQKHLNSLLAEKKDAVHRYQHTYKALLALGLSESDKALQPLNEQDAKSKDVTERRKLGDSKVRDPWFWHTGRPTGLSEEEENKWSIESAYNMFIRPHNATNELHLVDRVKWFRDQAALDRSREEKEILEEEFRRTIVSFTKMGEVWRKLVLGRSASYAAYAHEHAAMYDQLSVKAQRAFTKISELSKED
ncbi:hypothetical protein H0H93_002703 [Arthromyces matolae]|nr:hypothetical protein H0H93_002703 [Arthromyces matolae]